MSSTQMQLVSDQLNVLARDFRHAAEEARNLLTYNDEEAVRRRPSASSWSALECVVHLNLSAQAMLPGIRQAVEAAQESSQAKPAYGMDLTGRLLAWSLEPPAYIKLKAPQIAQPMTDSGIEPVLKEFEDIHDQLARLLQQSAGKTIDQQKLKSPFANIRYNAYSAFRIIAAHDRRHLWQAHKALGR